MDYNNLKKYAKKRGIYLENKQFLNNIIGIGYNIYIGWNIYQVKTLIEAYNIIKKYEKIEV